MIQFNHKVCEKRISQFLSWGCQMVDSGCKDGTYYGDLNEHEVNYLVESGYRIEQLTSNTFKVHFSN